MKHLKWCLILLSMPIFSQVYFNSIDDVMKFAESNTISLKNADLEILQAERNKTNQLLNIFKPTIRSSFGYTDNLQMPVSLFPAEIFGGQPGTFAEITPGTRYVTNANASIDLKLIDVSAWQNYKGSKKNEEIKTLEKTISKKQLYSNLSNYYFGILNLQKQKLSAEQNVQSADSLELLTYEKYYKGLINIQSLNDVKSNNIQSKEQLAQIKLMIEEYSIQLKKILNIESNQTVVISNENNLFSGDIEVKNTQLNTRLTKLSMEKAYLQQKTVKSMLMPTVSLTLSGNSQQNNPELALISDEKWINSAFLSLKLSFNLDVANQKSLSNEAKIAYLKLRNNLKESETNELVEQDFLTNKLKMAESELNSNRKILTLRQETYSKNLNLYQEGLLSTDLILRSFNDMVAAQYAFNSSRINKVTAEYAIRINNIEN